MAEADSTVAVVLHYDPEALVEALAAEENSVLGDALSAFASLIREVLLKLVGFSDYSHVELLNLRTAYKDGDVDSPLCLVVGPAAKGAEGQLQGVQTASYVFDLLGALVSPTCTPLLPLPVLLLLLLLLLPVLLLQLPVLLLLLLLRRRRWWRGLSPLPCLTLPPLSPLQTAQRMLPDLFTDKVGLDEHGALGFTDEVLGQRASALNQRLGLDEEGGGYTGAVSEEGDAELVEALGALVPEDAELVAVHPEDLLALLPVYVDAVAGGWGGGLGRGQGQGAGRWGGVRPRGRGWGLRVSVQTSQGRSWVLNLMAEGWKECWDWGIVSMLTPGAVSGSDRPLIMVQGVPPAAAAAAAAAEPAGSPASAPQQRGPGPVVRLRSLLAAGLQAARGLVRQGLNAAAGQRNSMPASQEEEPASQGASQPASQPASQGASQEEEPASQRAEGRASQTNKPVRGARLRGYSLQRTVWRVEDVGQAALQLSTQLLRHAARPLLVALVLHRAARVVSDSKGLEYRLARMSLSEGHDYYMRNLLGDDYEQQIQQDLQDAVREVDEGLVTDDYKDEKRLLTAAMLRRLEVEEWDKERMKHFYYGSYGLGPWYFDMEERLHNPFFIGARAWNGPIEGWVNKNRVYNDIAPEEVQFNAQAFKMIEDAAGVKLSRQQRMRIAASEALKPSDLLTSRAGLLDGIVNKEELD
ncbi:hypothetical protein QJQ45_014528 [Haematococcus lacustris]|nr:hypothetical protein QJQ45_014528 [Haematococcus lacustris]